MSALTRPDPSEHAEYYARYIAGVPDGDILETLRDQLGETLGLLRARDLPVCGREVESA